MMFPNKLNNRLVVFFLFLLPTILFGQLSGYNFKRKLSPVSRQQYYSIELSPELLSKCKSGLNDLRIYDCIEEDTLQVPYIFECLAGSVDQKQVPMDIINSAHHTSCCSFLTLKSNDIKHTINNIKLVINDANFDRLVSIEGSSDNSQWFTIKEKMRIVRFVDGREHFEHTSLEFPDAEYKYYRLKFDNKNDKALNITGAFAYKVVKTVGQFNQIQTKEWKQKENEAKKCSEIIVDFNYPVKLSHLALKSDGDKDFYRNINIYKYGGSISIPDGDRDYWILISTSVFSSEYDNTIYCNNETAQKLKIEIINHDDKPLNIKDIKAYEEKCILISELPASDNLFLTYGKLHDNAPVYDLVRFKNKIPETPEIIEYGEEQPIEKTVAVKKELIDNKSWLWFSMGAVMLVIVLFSYVMLKGQKNKENTNS